MNLSLASVVLVGAGGFVGAALRYILGGLIQRTPVPDAFPLGTLTVNMIGCLLIGTVLGALDARQLAAPEVRLFVVIGLLGGFTTYSAFGNETLLLLRDGNLLHAFASVLIHIIAGLVMVWAGYSLGDRLPS